MVCELYLNKTIKRNKGLKCVLTACSSFYLFIYLFYLFIYLFLFVVDFVIHWNETAKGLHVFPIPIPPPTSLSTHSL